MNNHNEPVRISLKPTVTRGTERKLPSKNHVMGATATIEDNVIVIRMPIISEDRRKKSASGKSILLANTYGPKIVRHQVGDELVPVEIDGARVRFIASVYLPLKETESKTVSNT